MTIELSISGINTLTNLIERLPQGANAQRLAQRLAVWTTQAHQNTSSNRKTFPQTLSELTEGDLSDVYAYWNSELIRIHELHGLLEGQRKFLDLLVRKERASARGRVRRKQDEENKQAVEDGQKPVKLTASEVNDRAEEDQELLQYVEVLAMIDMVMASVLGYREACVTATTGLSREISFRQAQFQARLR